MVSREILLQLNPRKTGVYGLMRAAPDVSMKTSTDADGSKKAGRLCHEAPFDAASADDEIGHWLVQHGWERM